MPSPAQSQLQSLLRDLFQFDDADLDFGIYRIMNQKRADVERFLQELPGRIGGIMNTFAGSERELLERELAQKREEVIRLMGATALTPEDTIVAQYEQMPLAQEFATIREKLESVEQNVVSEDQIYNDLLTFFARYYDNGDFIAQRRYGAADTYAVPYNGEEVLLYWANRDQYYVKTGERFSAYQFVVQAAGTTYTIRFGVDNAEVAQNNNKTERRFFMLRDDDPVAYDEVGRVVAVNFVYRTLTAGDGAEGNAVKQQERLLEEAARRIREAALPPSLMDALDRIPEGKNQPLLLQHLRRFSRRRSSDFFVHKDLGRFLRDELDTYIKHNLVKLDDLQGANGPALERAFNRYRAVREVALTVVDFLAQIENLQRRLFEKPKFVVRTDYLVTLDRVPASLYPAIAANRDQIAEWQQLYALKNLDPEAVDADWLAGHPTLMVDTRFFDQRTVDQILESIDDIDAAMTGTLFNSDNFQALRLMRETYRGSVKCIYIDPPYNTGNDDFQYKDRYQHSSWLAMMYDRLMLTRDILGDDGVIFISIDDHEIYELRMLMNQLFGSENFVAELVWEKTRKNDARFFSVGHEYMLVYAKSFATLRDMGVVWREPKPGAKEIMDHCRALFDEFGADSGSVEVALREWYKQLPAQHPSKKLSRYKHIDKYSPKHGPWRDRDISWPGGGGPRYDVIHPVTKKPCKVPDSGWRFSTPESMEKQIKLGLVVFREDDTEPPFCKRHLVPVSEELNDADFNDNGEDSELEDDETDGDAVGTQVMPSVIYKQSQVAVKYLRNMMGGKIFDNPKDHEVIARVIRYTAPTRAVVIDFFAGSGTTGQAVMQVNRQDDGNRKFVLVEMGEYFDSILKPRVIKAAYSETWKDGEPGAPVGDSHLIRYQRLEQYEDALNNITFSDEVNQRALAIFEDEARDEYLVRYMLDHESRDSATLLDIQQLAHPFDYQLLITDGVGSKPAATTVDLPATFAYLLGLRLRKRQALYDGARRYLVQRGTLPDGGEVVVIWRDMRDLDLPRDAEFIAKHIAPDGTVYVNGDSMVPGAQSLDIIFKTWMGA